jgi:hypothetical protein
MKLGQYLGSGSSITRGLYRFEGNSNDASGNSNNGTDTSITYSLANGKIGQGAGFTSSPNSRINLGSSATIQPLKPVSLICSINPANAGTVRSMTATSGNGLQWRLESSNVQGMNKQGVAGIGQSTTAVPASAWSRLGMSYSSSGTVIFYYNGSFDGSSTNNQTFSSATQYFSNSGTAEAMAGNLDEFVFESVELTPQYFKKDYTYYKGRFGII